MTSIETTNEAKNEMKVSVLMDLAALCKKLADNPVLTEELRANARQFVAEYNALAPFRGKGDVMQHFEGESLIIRMVRFLPRVLEIESRPAKMPDDRP